MVSYLVAQNQTDVIEQIIRQAYQWWTAGLLSSLAIFAVIFLLILYLGWRVFKGLIIQLFLFVISFVPSVITSYAININTLEPKPIVPLQGAVYLLFPYTWDTMLGAFKNTAFVSVCVLFIFLSFLAFWHLALLFCHQWHINKLYSFPLAYLGTVAFGLGLINFHSYVFNAYVNYMNSIGMHPAVPIVFFCMILTIITLLYLFVFKAKRKETITIIPTE
jgi:hypothetical protein